MRRRSTEKPVVLFDLLAEAGHIAQKVGDKLVQAIVEDPLDGQGVQPRCHHVDHVVAGVTAAIGPLQVAQIGADLGGRELQGSRHAPVEN